MQYRKFGKLEWKPSALGFGCMRLPQFGSEWTSPVNEELAIEMIRYAIDNGVNYADTAFPYHMGNSERVLGKALQDGYRDKIKLATKLTPRFVESPKDFDRYIANQLKRLKTDKIDFYLMHGLNKQSWNQLKEWQVLKWAERKMAEGVIGHLGFSFHDDYEVFKEIIDSYDNWTFCQVQYNYLDVERQAGRRGVEYAAEKGLAVVVMEPLRGGQLVKDPPENVAKVWENALEKHDRVEWALKWLWNQPEISVVLSGMSAMEHVVDNVKYAKRSQINSMSQEDLELFSRIGEAYESLAPIDCTDCQYCQPCPNNVAIPKIFALYNEMHITDDPRAGFFGYVGPNALPEEQRADKCIECGECLELCPQQLNIPEWLKKAHEALTPSGPMGPPPGPASFEEE